MCSRVFLHPGLSHTLHRNGRRRIFGNWHSVLTEGQLVSLIFSIERDAVGWDSTPGLRPGNHDREFRMEVSYGQEPNHRDRNHAMLAKRRAGTATEQPGRQQPRRTDVDMGKPPTGGGGLVIHHTSCPGPREQILVPYWCTHAGHPKHLLPTAKLRYHLSISYPCVNLMVQGSPDSVLCGLEGPSRR